MLNIKIELTYMTAKGVEATFYSDDMNVEQAVVVAEDLKQTRRIKQIHFTDSLGNGWSMTELKKYMEGIQTEPHHVTVYFDGGFNREEKQSGLGCAIYYEQNHKRLRLRKNALVEELDSNNEAEYAALYLGLQELEMLGVHRLPVTLIGDSKVVINQLHGDWPCYEENLSKWMDRIESQLERLGITPAYQVISRKKNREADQLASQALKYIEISSTKTLEE